MRLIGHIKDEAQAQTFSDYLYAEGIENETSPADDGSRELWIISEEQINQAKPLLEEFNNNPSDPKYAAATEFARIKKEQKERELIEFQKKIHDRDKIFFKASRPGLVTFFLIGVCVAVALLSRLGAKIEALYPLFFSSYVIENRLHALPSEIASGQVWRVITPIFIHFGFMHFLFNMMWLYDLGNMIEKRRSPWLLISLVLLFAAISNTGQYLVAGPSFGGMSGVVYGLVGYIWMRGKLEPRCGLFIHKRTFMMMIIWFFVCFMPGMPIANTAHAVGLGLGLALGYASAWLSLRKEQ